MPDFVVRWLPSVPPYDATEDVHCRRFKESNTFRRHWHTMKPTIAAQEERTELASRSVYEPQPPPPWFSQSGAILHDASRRHRSKLQRKVDVPRPPPSPYFSRIVTPRASSGKRKPPITEFTKLFAFRDEDESLLAKPKGDSAELLRTYLNSLDRSEDYFRRQLWSMEATDWKALSRRLLAARRHLLHLQNESESVCTDETYARSSLEEDEGGCRSLLTKRAHDSRKQAQYDEEVFPTCVVLKQYETAETPQLQSQAFAADLRWQCDTGFELVALLFDDSNRHMGTISYDNPLFKDGRNGRTVIRHWGDYVFTGAGIKGPRRSIELLLHNFSSDVTVSRVVLAIFNSSKPGSPVSAMRRGYFTLRTTDFPLVEVLPKANLRECVACGVTPYAAPCLVVASLLRNASLNTWMFQCLNRGFDVVSPYRLVPELKKSLLLTVEILWDLWLAEYDRMLKYNEYFFERISRTLVTVQQDVDRSALASAHSAQLKRLSEPRSRILERLSGKQSTIDWWENS